MPAHEFDSWTRLFLAMRARGLKNRAEAGPRKAALSLPQNGRLSRLRGLWSRHAYIVIPLSSLRPVTQSSNNPDLHEAIQWLPRVTIGGIVKAGLFMHPSSSVSYRLRVPSRAVFSGFTALMPHVSGGHPAPVTFELTVSSRSQGQQLRLRIAPKPSRSTDHLQWRMFLASLQRFADHDIDLTLSTLLQHGATADFARPVWGEPALRVRKGFQELTTHALSHLKALGLRGFLRKIITDGSPSSPPVGQPVRPTVTQPNHAISVGAPGQVPSLASPEETWTADLESFLTDALTFPSFPTPEVSIVIPTFNKAAYLYQCLKSILLHTDLPYEVIIVDDCSRDATSELLKRVRNVHVVTHDQNLDFIRACNNGARLARGRYILFLNNDVVVTPRWLSILAFTLDHSPDCGAVGAKLVRPDGTLQEAGSIVWQDGSATGYGRDDDPLKPEYCYRREVDYCSAACLLVRADLFRDVNGFDERYLPAYYEDTDLCLSIRERGYKVIYQPQVTVYHHEYGSRSRARAEALMEANQRQLVQKRADLLGRQYPYGDVLKARDRRGGRRILVIDDQVPAAYLGSGFPRAHKLVELLCESECIVTFIPVADPTAHEPTTHQLQQAGVEVFYGATFVPQAVFRNRAGHYDAVIVSRPHNAHKYLRLVRECFPTARVIYDAEAVFCLRDFLRAEAEGRRLTDRQKNRMLRNELAVMNQADVVMTVSEAERDVILSVTSHDNVVVWGHPHALHEPTTSFSARRDLLFVGGFISGHPPNIDAVHHFVEHLFPRILQALPDCRLFVVGSQPPASIARLASANIVITGFVPSLRQYYEQCRVFVAPIRFMAGISLKLIEAMSYGIPTVASSIAASGLKLRDGAETLVAQDDDDFITKVLELYVNETRWYEIQHSAQNYIRDRCSPETMRRQLAAILDLDTTTFAAP